ncbi:hypothetical protein DWV75_03835 [Ruminococcus sp. AF12-5]|nr:hypothetical protein DWV75_03835 [Ruminococcus sp. AF12-5]
MLLHKQKSLYYMDMEDKEKDNLRDMVLVAINEVTKFDQENMDEDRYDVGVDFSNISPFNPHMISYALQDLGYEEVDLRINGWEHDYWQKFTHPNSKKFPPMQLTGTSWIHKCQIHGVEDDYETYLHLENDPEYSNRIKNGLKLLSEAMNRAS